MRTALWVFIVVGSTACGKDKPDCAKYAKHVAEVGTRGLTGKDLESRLRTTEALSKDACESGRVTATVANCAIAANTVDEILACEGVGSTKIRAASSGSAPSAPRRSRGCVARDSRRDPGGLDGEGDRVGRQRAADAR
jgi:hypothetical protein